MENKIERLSNTIIINTLAQKKVVDHIDHEIVQLRLEKLGEKGESKVLRHLLTELGEVKEELMVEVKPKRVNTKSTDRILLTAKSVGSHSRTFNSD